ncbi:SWIM zinc finger family protein, partial [Cobetia marina]
AAVAATGLSNASFALNIALLQHGWRDEFDAGTLERGLRYARQQRVDEQWQVELDEKGGLTLSGDVAGSLGTPYRTMIMLAPVGTRHQMRTACSCPVGSTCKHAVALIDTFLSSGPLGKALEVPDTLEPDEVEQAPSLQAAKREWTIWLQHHSQAPAVPSAVQVGANHRLGLFLDVQSGHRGLPALTVQPVWLRPSKSKTQLDRWVSPVKVEVSHVG